MAHRLPLLAKNIKRLRKKRGWTQRQLGAIARTTSIAMLECGRRQGRTETLDRIAKAFGLTIDELIHRNAA